MVRLTVDLLLAAPYRFNPAHDRELMLRGECGREARGWRCG